MLPSIGITKQLVSSRLLLKASHCLSSNLHSLSLSHSTPSWNCECADFLPWLERKSGAQISSVVSIGKSTHGRSLFASKMIKTGSSILKIPYHAQISADDLSPGIKVLLGDEVGSVARVAVFILAEKKKGSKSEWDPYISRLPLFGETQTTVRTSPGEDELEMIKLSPVYLETIRKKAVIRREFSAVKPALDRYSEIFGSTKYMDFLHAYTLVKSRAWGTNRGSSLIPLADFLNHDGLAKSVVLSDEEQQISEVIADRDYSPGDEIWISYGKLCNATLLLEFGFTLPHNIDDEVQIQFKIPSSDPLYEMKKELLERRLFPASKDLRDFKHHSSFFTIKEVKSATGKGKGIPQSLRAAARVQCCTSAKELSYMAAEAAESDGRLGRRPFKDIERESQAHLILLSQINLLIGEYFEAIKVLDDELHVHDWKRKRMAYDLLAGELRVLTSASLWLQNYVFTLRQTM